MPASPIYYRCALLPSRRAHARLAQTLPLRIDTVRQYAGAPPPPHPRGLRLPLRGAVSVLGVTACGMIAAPLSREVTLRRTAPSPVGLRGLWSGRPLFRHRAVAATPSRLLQFRFCSFFRLLLGVAAGR